MDFNNLIDYLIYFFDKIPPFSLKLRKMSTRWGVNNVTKRNALNRMIFGSKYVESQFGCNQITFMDVNHGVITNRCSEELVDGPFPGSFPLMSRTR